MAHCNGHYNILTTSFICRDLLDKSNGYVNSSGAFKIKMQINLVQYVNDYFFFFSNSILFFFQNLLFFFL